MGKTQEGDGAPCPLLKRKGCGCAATVRRASAPLALPTVRMAHMLPTERHALLQRSARRCWRKFERPFDDGFLRWSHNRRRQEGALLVPIALHTTIALGHVPLIPEHAPPIVVDIPHGRQRRYRESLVQRGRCFVSRKPGPSSSCLMSNTSFSSAPSGLTPCCCTLLGNVGNSRVLSPATPRGNPRARTRQRFRLRGRSLFDVAAGCRTLAPSSTGVDSGSAFGGGENQHLGQLSSGASAALSTHRPEGLSTTVGRTRRLGFGT